MYTFRKIETSTNSILIKLLLCPARPIICQCPINQIKHSNYYHITMYTSISTYISRIWSAHYSFIYYKYHKFLLPILYYMFHIIMLFFKILTLINYSVIVHITYFTRTCRLWVSSQSSSIVTTCISYVSHTHILYTYSILIHTHTL